MTQRRTSPGMTRGVPACASRASCGLWSPYPPRPGTPRGIPAGRARKSSPGTGTGRSDIARRRCAHRPGPRARCPHPLGRSDLDLSRAAPVSTAPIRWRTRLAVVGLACQIGESTAITSSVEISSTPLSAKRGKTNSSSVPIHCLACLALRQPGRRSSCRPCARLRRRSGRHARAGGSSSGSRRCGPRVDSPGPPRAPSAASRPDIRRARVPAAGP